MPTTLDSLAERLDRIEAKLNGHEKIWTASGAADFLGISIDTLYRLCARHAIAYSRPGGKRIMFAEADLRNYALSNRVESDATIAAEGARIASERAAKAGMR